MLQDYFINRQIFEEKKSCSSQNVCFDCLYNFCLKHFSFYEEMSEMGSKMRIGLHVQYPLLLSILMKFSLQISEKYANIKFNENTSNCSRVVRCGKTDMTKLILAFRNLGKAPKNEASSVYSPIWRLKKSLQTSGSFMHIYCRYRLTCSAS
jgi:hypothetical protein